MLVEVVRNLNVYSRHVIEILEDRFTADGIFKNSLDCRAWRNMWHYSGTCFPMISILPVSYADKSVVLEFILQYWSSIS